MPTFASTAEPQTSRRLRARSMETGYGNDQVLFGIDLEIAQGEIVAVIGHNGAGKSTFLASLVGLLPLWRGEILIDENPVQKVSTWRLGEQGIALVPQGGRVFSHLSVRENLVISATAVPAVRSLEDSVTLALEALPALRPLLGRYADTLSGGERQMLSLGMGLAKCPRFLLLDEPSLGLSPSLTEGLLNRLQSLRDERNLGIMVVEQKVRQVISIADRVYLFRNGRVAHSGPAAELRSEEAIVAIYL